jgi:hypothetical protein
MCMGKLNQEFGTLPREFLGSVQFVGFKILNDVMKNKNVRTRTLVMIFIKSISKVLRHIALKAFETERFKLSTVMEESANAAVRRILNFLPSIISMVEGIRKEQQSQKGLAFTVVSLKKAFPVKAIGSFA